MGGCALHKDAEWMRQRYLDEGLSTYQIADLIGVPKTNVEYWLKKHCIPMRSKAVVNKMRAKAPGDDETFLLKLRDLYIGERRTVEEVAKIIGMSKTQTTRLLRKACVDIRTSGEGHRGRSWSVTRKRPTKKTDILTAEMLYGLYHEQGLSTYTIAEMYNTQANQVLGRMRELKVPIRRQVESIHHRFDQINHIALSRQLMEILEGELLGDGSVQKRSARSGGFSYGTSKSEYARWLANVLIQHGLEVSEPQPISVRHQNGVSTRYDFDSKAYPELLNVWERWYPGGVKHVPCDLVLTPAMVRHWYIGDGHLNKRGGFINIATQSFPREEVEFLADQLRTIIGDARLWKSQFGHGWVIGILRRFVPAFLEYIGPCPEPILPVYGYKWGVANGP